MKQWHFFDKVYRVWLTFLIGEPDAFYDFMERSGYKDMEYLKQGSTAAWCIKVDHENNDMGNYCFVIWMRKFEAACLVHELTHLSMMVFDDKGVPVRNENTEAFAYYTEFWFNEINRTRRRLPNGRTPAQLRKSLHA